jgi:glycosyltransferase involved in cell wall biosynthesis
VRILVINWQDIRHPLGGGAEVHCHEIFRRIAGRGHEVTQFSCAFPGAPAEERIDGVTVVRGGSRPAFNLAVPAAYRRRFRHERYDVVVDDLNKIPFLTPYYVREPVYGIAHHLFGTAIFREANPLSAAYVFGTERLGLPVYRRAGVPFMVVSPSTQAEFLAAGFPEPALPLVYNCVDHSRFRPTGVPKSPVPLIGYFGRLKKYKSVDHLVRAFAFVLRVLPDARLVIVGHGDDRTRLERLVATLRLADRVEFTGFVPEERKVDLLQEMWVNVTPSFKEGWGLTVVEANACGTPVVASDVPGLRDSVRDGETGLLYPYGDIPALTRAILRVLEDDALRMRLGVQARAWAKQFDWEVMATRAEELLRQRVEAARENQGYRA